MQASWPKDTNNHRAPLAAGRLRTTRRAAVAGGAIALAAALAGCADDDVDYDPLPARSALGPRTLPPPQPLPPAHTDPAPPDDVASAPDLTIAGEKLNTRLLRRFYGRRGMEPVWVTRQAQADALLAAVLRAPDHGLNPELFHATVLRQAKGLSPSDRDMLLSDAILSYADALARGAVPVERRKEDQALAPEPVDVAAVLDGAIDSFEPAAAIEALAPDTPTYAALRRALGGIRSGGTPGRAVANLVHTIEVNLERQRWLTRQMPSERVWVNVADERLVMSDGMTQGGL